MSVAVLDTVTTLEIVEETKLAEIASSNFLQPEETQSLQAAFAPFFVRARDAIAVSKNIIVTDVSQRDEIKQATVSRIQLKNIRVAAKKTHDELKEDSLRKGKAIDGFYNILLHVTETEEKRLQAQEDFAERKERERRAALIGHRTLELAGLGVDTSVYRLDEVTEDAFVALKENAVLAKAARDEQARKAKEAAELLAAEQAKEAARIREDNARLRREADELAAETRKEKLRQQALADVERQKADTARLDALAEAKKQKEISDQLAIELQKAKAAEAKAKFEAGVKRLAEEEAAKAHAALPNKEKLLAFAEQIRALPMPATTSRIIDSWLRGTVDDAVNKIIRKATTSWWV